MVNLDRALGEQYLDVPVGEVEPQAGEGLSASPRRSAVTPAKRMQQQQRRWRLHLRALRLLWLVKRL
jgi:hypothetical protein